VYSSTADLSPMSKWLGYSVYKATRPEDPQHLADFWVANNGELIKFEMAPKGEGQRAADSVTLRSDGQSLLLDVGIGARTNWPFVLDTGASEMTVTQSLADELVREGYAVRGEHETVTYADGKPHDVPTISVDAVMVGTHRVTDVHVSVSPDRSPMLLGLGVLNRIGRFTVDVANHRLLFEGVAS
jgi:clan AA aspartic protease (TIGR02281 family)